MVASPALNRSTRVRPAPLSSGGDASKSTKLSVKVLKGAKTVASGSGKLSHKKAKIVIKPKKALKAGKYTLKFTITQGKAKRTQSVSVRVK